MFEFRLSPEYIRGWQEALSEIDAELAYQGHPQDQYMRSYLRELRKRHSIAAKQEWARSG